MPIQFGSYDDTVRATQETATVLAAQLSTNAPPDADAKEKKALHEIELEAAQIARDVSARERAAPAAVRPFWLENNGAWTGAHDVAAAKARLDPETPTGADAQLLMTSIFADGVPTTQMDALQSYGVSIRMLARIHDEKLEKAVLHVVGKELYELIQSTTSALGEALGAGETRAPSVPSSTAIQDGLTRFGRKVGAYCRLLSAKVVDDDEESERRFLDAVAPIDALRASLRGSSSGDAEDTTTTTPASPATPPKEGGNGSGS